MLTCSGCGFEAPPEFAFCPKCGRPLEAAQLAPLAPTPLPPEVPEVPEADRRLATILFADLTGFTSISERLDPEEVRALQTDLFDALRTVLEGEEAFVEKFVGDAVMAVFGAPVAHEDDAQRALRAALAMHAQAARLSERWRDRIAQPLHLHIGVNSGRVVAGQIGSAAGAAYAVTGDAVNVAARLQAAAEAGATLVSAETRSLARAGFEFEAGGEVALKGKSHKLSVFRLLGRAVRTAHATLMPRLVGRAQELEALHAALASMQRNEAQVVGVEGEAGSGKSRLVDAFVHAFVDALADAFADDARAAMPQPTLRRTQCAANETRPYGTIARFLRDGFGLAPDDDLAAVRAKVEQRLAARGAPAADIALVVPMAGYLLGLPASSEAADAEPERLQRQIGAAMRIVLELRLREGPLVLVVEDVQWADAASLAALAAMADWMHDRPLMLLLTCRTAADLAGFDAGRAKAHRIVLAPLDRAQSEELLASCFGSSGSGWMPAQLRAALLARAGGNPYFLEALLRGLIDARVLVDGGGHWRCDEQAAAAQDVPATLEGLLLSRLDRLAPPLRQCLQEASVLGASFDAGLLGELRGAAFDAAALDELAAQGHIARGAGSATQWRFCALLARDVVYGNLLLKRRVELHGRVARLLEARRDPHHERFDDLQAMGEHFCRGGDALRGARYLALAGDWARSIYANDDAIGLYQRAQAALASKPEDEDALRADVVEAIGDLHALGGRRAQAFAAFDDALARSRALGERPREARLQRKRATLHWDAGARDASRACLDAGLALLDAPGAGRDIEAAHLLQELGRHAFRTGDNEAALRFAERALVDARRCADAATAGSAAARDAGTAIAQALNTQGAALARLERPQEAVAAIEESIAVAEANGMLQAACRGYANLGVLYASIHPAQAIATCRRGLETATRIGDLGFQSRLYANLAVAYCALTNQCDIEGLRAAEAAIDLDRRLGQLDHLAVPLIVLAQIHQCHGDPQQALRYYAEACELAERIGEPQLLFPVYDGLGTLYLDLGDDEQAERYLIRANEVCDAAGLDRDSLVVLPFLC